MMNSKILNSFILNFLLLIMILMMMFIMLKFSFNMDVLMFDISSFNFSLSLMFNKINIIFSLFVLTIVLSIMKFSAVYMKEDLMYVRFMKLVFLFIISMEILLVSSSFLLMMVGWDGLGISSFLLVIYYHSWKSMSGSLVTLIMNRLGDAIIMSVVIIMLSQGNLKMENLLFFNDSMMFTSLFIVSLMTKSAQVPFIMWLPEAMEAPTPVSALVHSSTLVTAGIYVLITIYPSIESFKFNSILLTMGVWTMFVGGMVGMFLKDSKKVIALSTLSQLGFMIIIISLGYEVLGFIHLLVHASFKALLFMCVGLEMTFKMHEQNFKIFNMKSFMNSVMVSKLCSLLSLNACVKF